MRLSAILTAAAIGMSATIVQAQDGPSPQEKARQGMMRIIALNMGVLGGMAKGEILFDAGQATAAANSLVAVSLIDQRLLWPEGSDNDTSFNTIALPAIWEKPAEFGTIWSELGIAALGLQAAAAKGRSALGPALGKAGGTCKACHETFRASDN